MEEELFKIAKRPDHDKIREYLIRADKANNPRDRALIYRDMVDFMCSYYEVYIKSLLQRIEDLSVHGDKVLGEVVELKQMVAKLGKI